MAEPKLCKECGQPVKPGRHKENEYDHAQGCSLDRSKMAEPKSFPALQKILDWDGFVGKAEVLEVVVQGRGELEKARELLAAATYASERRCSCHSSSEKDWHGPRCDIPKLRAAIAACRERS